MPSPPLLPPSPTTRTQVTLARIAEAWRKDVDPARGGQFVQALRNFLTSLQSPHTRRSYSFSILEFYDWYEKNKHAVPTPDRIERADAIHFADWLRNRAFGIDEYRLRRDAERKLEAAIYEAVRLRPQAHIADIRNAVAANQPGLIVRVADQQRLAVERDDPAGLDKFLACMVERKFLRRTPSLEELRRRDPKLMHTLAERVDPDIFAYEIDPHTDARGAERSSTIATRLMALSSFWSYLIRSTGENVGNRKPLLEVNIWAELVKKASQQAPAHRALRRAQKTPDLTIMNRLLGTTELAGGALSGRTEDVRDRALLMFLFYTGLRVDELTRLRRSDIAGRPPLLTIIGKGDKPRSFVVPDPAIIALNQLTAKIQELATAAELRQPGAVPRWTRLLADEAPLFPAVARWGCAATSARAANDAGLTRQAVAMMLRRRATAAGIERGSVEWPKVHPHGIRHLAASTSAELGTPLPVIQAALGHSSLATTGIYVEARDPRSVSLFQPGLGAPGVAPVAPPPQAAPPTPAPPRPAPPPKPAARRKVVETVGVPVVEAPAATMPPSRAIAVPEPTAAAPVLPGQGLTAVGQLAPSPRPLPSEVEHALLPPEPGALQRVVTARDVLAQVYDTNWGEAGKGQRGMLEKGVPNVYRGHKTGLLWWGGPTGKLSPVMPILSPDQLGECTTGAQSPLCAGLVGLWTKWFHDETKGPTAASALVRWIGEAVEIANVVETIAGSQRTLKKYQWVPHDAPLALTGPTSPTLRQHDEQRIVDWFEQVASEHLSATGDEREGKHGLVKDTPFTVPAWYASADPVGELLDTERRDLIDWLMVLQGKPPRDTLPRFHGASRAQLGEIVGLMCLHDESLDHLAEMKKGRGGSKTDRENTEMQLKAAVAGIRDQVKKATQGRISDFDFAAVVKKRVEASKLARAGEDVTARRRKEGYLAILGTLFGSAAASDPYLAAQADWCPKSRIGGAIVQRESSAPAPLATRDMPVASGGIPSAYTDFFRVPKGGKTIEHTPEFAKAFAQATGMHSECAARRAARHLWEARRASSARSRPDELARWIDTLAFYRVPCPASQERELQKRLSGAPVPIYEEWNRWRMQLGLASDPMLEELALPILGSGPEAAPEMERNARARLHSYTPNARAVLPSPVVLMFWANAMRRRR